MARLTAQQANEFGKNFLSIAQEIRDYRIQNFDDLTKTQNQKLRSFHMRVLRYSDDLFSHSATLVMDDVQASLTLVESVTEKLKTTYQSVRNVQKVINVAENAVALGTAIFSKSPLAITNAIDKLRETIDS